MPEIIVRARGCGKTVELIKRCASSGGYIACFSREEAQRIVSVAESLGYKIPYPLTFSEVLNKEYYPPGVKKLHIDNADYLLQMFLQAGTKLETATWTWDGVNWEPTTTPGGKENDTSVQR